MTKRSRRAPGALTKPKRTYSPETMQKRREYSRARSARVKAQRKRWLDKYKLAKGCSHCGYKEHPSALVWDHIEPLQDWTAYRIASMYTMKLTRLMDEVRKCQILCSNCHAIRTDAEGHNK